MTSDTDRENEGNATVCVPADVWLTVHSCFVGYCGIEMQHRTEWPHSWARAVRFIVNNDPVILARMGVPEQS